MYEWYDSYEKLYQGPAIPEDRIRLLLTLVNGVRTDSLLDVGCGDGSLTIRFKEKLGAKSVAGIEISQDGVLAARKQGIDARKANLDLEKLPFDEASFDFVLCSEVIEHLFDPDNILKEIHRVLRPNGFLLLTTPNISSWYDRLSLLLGYQPISVPVSLRNPEIGRLRNFQSLAGREHVRFFTTKAIKLMLMKHGFQNMRVSGWMKVPENVRFPIDLVIRALDRIFALRVGLCTTTIVLCSKP